MASFGFGVGDFLGAASLAYKIAIALSDSSGASSDYQSFIRELDALELCLKSTHDTLKNVELPSSSVNALKKEGYECQKLLKELETIVDKYREKLGAGKKSKWGIGQSMGNSWQKIGWSLFQREEVTKLRVRLGEHVANITLVLQGCGVLTLSHVEKLSRHVEKQVQETSAIVKQIQDAMPNTQQLGIFTNKMTDVEGRIAENTEIVRRIERRIAIPNGLDFLWDSKVTPVTFIDALDRQVFLPYELCKNWPQLHETIKLMFRGHPGSERVNNANFALTNEGDNGTLILPPDIVNIVEPGMKLAMSMVVERVGKIDDPEMQRCPVCQVKFEGVKVRLNEWMRCTVCAGWFQVAVFSQASRITDLGNAGNKAIENTNPTTTEIASSSTIQISSSNTNVITVASSSSSTALTTYSGQLRHLRGWRNQASYWDSDIRFFRRIFLIFTDPEQSPPPVKPTPKPRLLLPAAQANNPDTGIKAVPSYGPPDPEIPDFTNIEEAAILLEYSRHKVRAAYIHQEFSIQGKLAPVVVSPRRCVECLEHGDWAKCWVLLQNPYVKASCCGTCLLLGRECVPSE